MSVQCCKYLGRYETFVQIPSSGVTSDSFSIFSFIFPVFFTTNAYFSKCTQLFSKHIFLYISSIIYNKCLFFQMYTAVMAGNDTF